METESLRSAYTDVSSRSKKSRSHGNYKEKNIMYFDNDNGLRQLMWRLGTGSLGSRRNHHHHRNHHNRHTNRSDAGLSPYSSKVELGMNGNDIGEVIEVQILPQDDNWGDNTTVITGTSDRSFSMNDVTKIGNERDLGLSFKCQRHMGSTIAAVLSAMAFLSPVLMVALPKLDMLDWEPEQLECGPQCDGMLVSFSFKLFILMVGTWAIFFRQPKATMPRIFIFRALVLALVFIFTFSYWLFYCVRVLERKEEVIYENVVVFALSLVDSLLFIHYFAVILIELRHLQPQYFLKVVRSPDGESKCFTIGQLSIQRAAIWVLERYYCEFKIYNPYLERLPSRNRGKSAGYKVYDVDGAENETGSQGQSRAVLAANARHRDSSHNERFYEEHEYERRVQKRKARLITAAEEAFTHIKRLQEEPGPAIPMEPYEAAQAVFPSLARALQKYLRITRQQPNHTMESILQHLATCLAHDMSPKAFLEKYFNTSPVFQNDHECNREIQTWALVCDTLLSRPLQDGTLFQLRQNDVALLCSIHRLPHLNVAEEIIDPKANKFVLRLNSETSV
uniref:Vang-like protein n=1 Tax=Strigamia maritima TaxID=126957 RepID=T1ITI0_STRMM